MYNKYIFINNNRRKKQNENSQITFDMLEKLNYNDSSDKKEKTVQTTGIKKNKKVKT